MDLVEEESATLKPRVKKIDFKPALPGPKT